MFKTRTNQGVGADKLALIGFFFGCAALLPRAQAQEATNRAPLVLWDKMIRATVGGGYRDNVLRTSVAPENSSFFVSSADAFITRLSESGNRFVLFLFGEDIRYFDAPSVDKEQLFSGSAQYHTPMGTREEVGGELLYYYQNAILDVSETQADLRRVLVEGHTLTLRPKWTHEWHPAWKTELEPLFSRQFYRGDLDDYWEAAGRLSLVYRYGHRSDISLGYQSLHRFYDTREQYDRSGFSEPGTSLVYWQNELGSQWRHYWDGERHWRTTTKASFLFNRDNGSDYFGYDRLLFSEQLRWGNAGWEIKAQGRFGWYYYDVQRIGEDHRHRSYYTVDLHVERRLGKYGLLYATAEREWNFSNDPLDEYRDWMVSGGTGVEF